MLVRELIDVLERMNPDTEIYIEANCEVWPMSGDLTPAIFHGKSDHVLMLRQDKTTKETQ